jgi:hypothetical protein
MDEPVGVYTDEGMEAESCVLLDDERDARFTGVEHIEWLQEELGQFSKSLSILWPSQGEDCEMGTVSIPLF